MRTSKGEEVLPWEQSGVERPERMGEVDGDLRALDSCSLPFHPLAVPSPCLPYPIPPHFPISGPSFFLFPPPGFQKVSNTVYSREGEQVKFSFPLNFEIEKLSGELRWRTEGAPSSLLWSSFTLENKKLFVKEVHHPRLQLKETLPLSFILPQASSQYAGSGTLTLSLAKGTLQQEVNLVVMRGEELD